MLKHTINELLDSVIPDGISITGREMQKARAKDVDMFIKIAKEYENNKKNREKTFAWYYQAALQDNDGAQYNVGYSYHWGDGVLGEYQQAMDWFLKAANNGNINAMRMIGHMYRNGKGVTRNIPTAIEWYTKAANQGNTEAQCTLGEIYQTDDVLKDLQKAVNWYQKAADNNIGWTKVRVKKLNDNGYFAEEEQKEKEEANSNSTSINVNMGNVINAINNERSQPITTSNNSDEYINKLVDDKMKNIVNELQKRMNLVEEENKNNRAFLEEENKQLREELADLKKRLQSITIDNTNTAPLSDYSENKSNINDDIESSTNEQDVADDDTKDTQQQNPIPSILTEEYADPNYNSSDNEDPRNDIYFD